jgi:membrane protease YdiL (CAAX protease family)
MLIQKVFAQEVPVDLNDPTGGRFSDLGDIFGFVVNLIIGVGWALVFVMLALGFVQYVTSKGEKDAVESAQKWLTYAVIGGVGLFFITFIKTLLPTLLGTSGDTPAPWINF